MNAINEILAISVLISVVLHLGSISIIDFTPPKPTQRENPTLDIVLVQKRTLTPPEKADFLGQTSQEGGGENEQKQRPSTPTVAPFPDNVANTIVTPPPQQLASIVKPPKIKHVTTKKPRKHKVTSHKPTPQPENPVEQDQQAEETSLVDTISASSLIMDARTQFAASLQAEINEKFNNLAKRPRRKYLSASTKEYKYANYMQTWRRKVERIGTLHYPGEARRKKLNGSLTLNVAIKADGTIDHVEIRETSKHKILDNAALQIVHLAAPFAPFPKDIRDEVDIIHITRTWTFTRDNLVSH